MGRGFTIIELVIVLAIIAIIATISAPALGKFYRTYKFKEYAYTVESSVRLAKILAVERSVNVEVCVQNNTLTVYNAGTSRSCSCSGEILGEVRINDSWITMTINALNDCINFDPRGIAIFGGNICLRSDSGGFSIYVQPLRGFIRVVEGQC